MFRHPDSTHVLQRDFYYSPGMIPGSAPEITLVINHDMRPFTIRLTTRQVHGCFAKASTQERLHMETPA